MDIEIVWCSSTYHMVFSCTVLNITSGTNYVFVSSSSSGTIGIPYLFGTGAWEARCIFKMINNNNVR